MGEEKDVWHIGNVHRAMNAVTWLVPIYLPGCNFDSVARVAIAEFDGQSIAFEHDRHAMKRVSVPPRGLARREYQPPYQCRSTVMKRSSTTRLLRIAILVDRNQGCKLAERSINPEDWPQDSG